MSSYALGVEQAHASHPQSRVVCDGIVDVRRFLCTSWLLLSEQRHSIVSVATEGPSSASAAWCRAKRSLTIDLSRTPDALTAQGLAFVFFRSGSLGHS